MMNTNALISLYLVLLFLRLSVYHASIIVLLSFSLSVYVISQSCPSVFLLISKLWLLATTSHNLIKWRLNSTENVLGIVFAFHSSKTPWR
jgi:hypothetical protein